MSQNGKKQTIQIDGKKVSTRISTKRLRQLKEATSIDLSNDGDAVQEFGSDPLVVCEVCWGLYSDRLVAAGYATQDDFEDAIGPEEITLLREEVGQQMRSFSSLWTTLSMVTEAVQSGNTSHLQQLVEMAESADKLNKDHSGPSS